MINSFKKCELCPRLCRIDRNKNKGFCNSNNKIKIAKAALHFYEEPCISGLNGSGTIFFSNCNLRCVYCQNYEISNDGFGEYIDVNRLVEIFYELKSKGALNINLVTPTHYVPLIIEAIKIAKNQGFDLPFIYNTNSYETIETIKSLNGLIDVYLADLKYYDDELAIKYSKCNNYFINASKAIDEMVKQVNIVFDKNGMIKKGVIIRHLILPGLINDSKKIIEYIYKTYNDKVYISIMNQYTPLKNVENYKEINRTITKKEYNDVINYAIKLGVINGFIQEDETASDSFIPMFDLEGVKKITNN